ncbi:hypothetical protein [Thalassobius sp. I31.1]|uniref:hypothetical protein n=1 Tax=Thalassobius sp. I31.1 TaxID=2109912 RepID=UPI0013001A5F|nr:hypothetical protein [Thalassobius sp. I31.1]
MQIDHPKIFSYRPMSFMEYLTSCEQIDGDDLLAFHIEDSGHIANDVLVVKADPYRECDDRYLEYNDKKHIWGVDTFTMQDVVRSFRKLFPDGKDQDVLIAAHYYIINDAFILPKYWDDFVQGRPF